MRKISSNKKAVAAIFGASFCLREKRRADLLQKIARQKQEAGLGDAQDRMSLSFLEDEIRRLDAQEAKQQADLRAHKGIVPLGCKSKEVTAIIACMNAGFSDRDPACREPILKMTLLVTHPPYLGDPEP